MSETKGMVIYDNPTDPAAFEAAYEAEQLEAARRIPGYLRLEASKVWPKEDGTPTPAYRMIDLYYPTYDAVSVAVTTRRPARSSKPWGDSPPAAYGSWSPTSRCRSTDLEPARGSVVDVGPWDALLAPGASASARRA